MIIGTIVDTFDCEELVEVDLLDEIAPEFRGVQERVAYHHAPHYEREGTSPAPVWYCVGVLCAGLLFSSVGGCFEKSGQKRALPSQVQYSAPALP